MLLARGAVWGKRANNYTECFRNTISEILQQQDEERGIKSWNKMLDDLDDVVERMQTRVTSVGESWQRRAGMLLSWSCKQPSPAQ